MAGTFTRVGLNKLVIEASEEELNVVMSEAIKNPDLRVEDLHHEEDPVRASAPLVNMFGAQGSACRGGGGQGGSPQEEPPALNDGERWNTLFREQRKARLARNCLSSRKVNQCRIITNTNDDESLPSPTAADFGW